MFAHSHHSQFDKIVPLILHIGKQDVLFVVSRNAPIEEELNESVALGFLSFHFNLIIIIINIIILLFNTDSQIYVTAYVFSMEYSRDCFTYRA